MGRLKSNSRSELVGDRVTKLNKESLRLGSLFWSELLKWDHTGTVGSDCYYQTDVLDMLERQARERL